MTSLPVFIARIYASNSFFFASSKDNMVSRPASAGCRCMLSQTTVRSSQLHVAWCGWVLFRECRRTYFHSAFPLLVLKTKSGSRLVVIVVICLAVTKTGPYLHATFVSVLSKYQFLSLCHNVFILCLPSSSPIQGLFSSIYPQGLLGF